MHIVGEKMANRHSSYGRSVIDIAITSRSPFMIYSYRYSRTRQADFMHREVPKSVGTYTHYSRTHSRRSVVCVSYTIVWLNICRPATMIFWPFNFCRLLVRRMWFSFSFSRIEFEHIFHPPKYYNIIIYDRRDNIMTSSGINEAPGENQGVAAPRPSSAVVVRSAYKQYGQTYILKDLNMTIPNGKM